MREMPPVLNGTEQQQLSQLRDYLIRMNRTLEQAEVATADLISRSVKEASAKSASSGSSSVKGLEEIKSSISNLRSLIQKTSNDVEVLNGATGALDYAVDTNSTTSAAILKVLGVSTDYIAKSDYGAYEQKLSSEILATAGNMIESYDYYSAVQSKVSGDISDAVGSVAADLAAYEESMHGMIVRGYITVDGVNRFGIAIAKELKVTGNTITNNGLVYDQLESSQTFGFYGSEGWEYWVNGIKTAWVDSQTSTMRLANARIDSNTYMSGAWQWKDLDGLGLKFVG